MPNPASIGVIMLAVGGVVLLLWLVFAWWDYGKRGEQSGAISRVGYHLLESNVGRKPRQQITALFVLAIALVVLLVILLLVLRGDGTQHWSDWGA